MVKQQGKTPSKSEESTSSPINQQTTPNHGQVTEGPGVSSSARSIAAHSGGLQSRTKLTSTKTSSSHDTKAILSQTVTSVKQPVVKLEPTANIKTEIGPVKNVSHDREMPKTSTTLCTTLYGDTPEKFNKQEEITQDLSSQITEQSSGMISDSSELSDRRKMSAAGDSARESETSRVTTDSDHSVSSALSDGSRRRRKDKSSLRKSKLNEGSGKQT